MERHLIVFAAVCLVLVCGRQSFKPWKINWNNDMRECYGTFNGLSSRGDAAFRYAEFRSRYSGCNRVLGNLEINFLNDATVNYDLSFLSEIREITGYLVVVNTLAEKLSMPNLEAIRGVPQYLHQDSGRPYSIFISLNYQRYDPSARGLKEIHMPNLREITSGGIFIAKNKKLCHADSINWNGINRHLTSVDFIEDNNETCERCDPQCRNATTDQRHCWGPGADHCQQFGPVPERLPAIPVDCAEDVKYVCKKLATELTGTIITLRNNLNSVTRKTRKLQKALKGQRTDK